MSKKNKCNYNPNPYGNAKVSPCSSYLNNVNPIIKDGKLIYRNLNSAFYFISTNPIQTIPPSIKGVAYISTNIQISLNTFLVGLYISQIKSSTIKYNKNDTIHPNKSANNFIHKVLQKNPKIISNFSPSLIFTLSNSNSILSLYTSTINITVLNYYILFILNRLENDPGLFFGNNSYTTPDVINFDLASINLSSFL